MTQLRNKVAIVTGGARGIGLAAATRFVREGAKVLLVDQSEDALRAAVDAIGSDAVSHAVADVSQPGQVERYTRLAVERYGGIDVFINNAGIEGECQPIVDYPVDIFDRVMAVNARGAWLGLKYVIPEMQKRGGGSIVITSSVAGVAGFAGLSAYTASKHAVVGMMRCAAAECAPMKIRVNTVNPGPIDTHMIHAVEEKIAPGDPERARQGFLAEIPLQRYGTPEEIADLMLFLASDRSSYCTGGVFMIDGGMAKHC